MQIGRAAGWAAVVTCVVGMAAACGDGDGDGGGSPTDVSSAASSSSTFPVTVAGANGDVTIESRPQRMAPVTDLSAFRTNVEAIGEFDPDLVLVARDRDDLVATLGSVGIPVLVLPSAAGLEEVFGQIETIGVVTGHAEAAAALSAALRTEVDAQLARAPDFAVTPTYFYELSADYHTHTSATLLGSILARLGLLNVADEVDVAAGAYPQLNAEFVLQTNPDWVFVAHTDGSVQTLDDVAARPGWETLDAIGSGRVVMLDVDVASRWGPRVVELVTAIVDALSGAAE